MAGNFEYRVSWKREGAGRTNTRIFQTKAAAKRLILILEGKLAEAYPGTDPNGFACCSGQEAPFAGEGPCTCGGRTWAEQWQERHEQFPPIVEGPRFETREVGGWRATSVEADRGDA